MKIKMNDAKNLSVASTVISSGTNFPREKTRAVRRIPLVAAVEVTERDSQTLLCARTSEIGLGGCYVDTLSPFPDGTLVDICISRDGGIFQCEAKVVYVHANVGMGIAFTNIALDRRRLLENWIADLIAKQK
jgi:hypothetical protein